MSAAVHVDYAERVRVGHVEDEDAPRFWKVDDLEPIGRHELARPAGRFAPCVWLARQAAGVPLVDLAQISSRYGATVALENVSLKIWPGQFMALVGPNGGGKTTLLRTILGMVPASSGKVLLRGRPLTRSALDRIGYVPQLETIDWNFPITVEEVISMGFFVKNRWFAENGYLVSGAESVDCAPGLWDSSCMSSDLETLPSYDLRGCTCTLSFMGLMSNVCYDMSCNWI